MARLTCGHMIRLLAHSLPPLSCQQHVSLPQSSWMSPIKLTDAKVVGKGWAEEPNHTSGRKPGILQIIQYSLPEPHINQHKINGVQEVWKTHHRYYTEMKKLLHFPPAYQEIWKEIECSHMRKDYLFIWGNKWMFNQMWGTSSIFYTFFNIHIPLKELCHEMCANGFYKIFA